MHSCLDICQQVSEVNYYCHFLVGLGRYVMTPQLFFRLKISEIKQLISSYLKPYMFVRKYFFFSIIENIDLVWYWLLNDGLFDSQCWFFLPCNLFILNLYPMINTRKTAEREQGNLTSNFTLCRWTLIFN